VSIASAVLGIGLVVHGLVKLYSLQIAATAALFNLEVSAGALLMTIGGIFLARKGSNGPNTDEQRVSQMENSRQRFDLYFRGALMVLLVGTEVYFAFHLAWNLILVSFLLVCFGSVSAVAEFYRTWRKSPR
jgi:hypothetical protein